MTIEIRYDRGYRFLDRCGEALKILEDVLPEVAGGMWVNEEIAVTGARLRATATDLTVLFDSARILIEHDPTESTDDCAKVAAVAWEVIEKRFDVGAVSRAGCRLTRLTRTESAAEAKQLSVQFFPSTAWFTFAKDDLSPIEAASTIRWEDEDLRRGIRLEIAPFVRPEAPVKPDPRLNTPPHLLPARQHEALLEQLRRRKKAAGTLLAGTMIDTDFYWVYPKDFQVLRFVNEASSESEKLVNALLQWKRS